MPQNTLTSQLDKNLSQCSSIMDRKKTRSILPPFDCALAALIEDLHERGLDKDVLVVAWGEFGQDPEGQ